VLLVFASVYHYAVEENGKARGRPPVEPPAEPQLDSGDDTDHGSVVIATGKKR